MPGPTRRAALAMGAAATLAASPRLARAQAQQLVIGTGTTGGVYFPLGGALANYLSPRHPRHRHRRGDRRLHRQLPAARRQAGRMSSARWTRPWTHPRRRRFRGRPVPARAIAVLYTNRMQVVTTTATGIGPWPTSRASASPPARRERHRAVRLRLIAAAGLDIDKDFRGRERLSPAESTNAIRDNKLDAYFFVSGVPTSAITDLAASPGTIHLIDHAGSVPKIVAEARPRLLPRGDPGRHLSGPDGPNKQLSVANILAVREDMPAELVTQILDIVWTDRGDWAGPRRGARLHPGAAEDRRRGRALAPGGRGVLEGPGRAACLRRPPAPGPRGDPDGPVGTALPTEIAPGALDEATTAASSS